MKVILVHGDHTQDSYQRLVKFINIAKNRGWEIERLEDSTKSLPETLSASTLFKEERLFIINDISKIPKKDITWVQKNYKNLPGTMVIYNEGYLGKRIIQSLPKLDKEEVYKYPKLIYKFLESFYPGNQQTCLKMLYALKDRHAPEYIVAILSSHLRDVYIAMVDKSLLKYPSWRTGKLKSQSDKFSKENLKEVISSLANADYNSKTSSESVYSSLDLIIATQLE